MQTTEPKDGRFSFCPIHALNADGHAVVEATDGHNEDNEEVLALFAVDREHGRYKQVSGEPVTLTGDEITELHHVAAQASAT